jgi:16S rRNA (guanine527-N7)-methyltransferase
MTTGADARIAELARRYSLPGSATSALGTLVRVVMSDPGAATGLRNEQRVIDDHLADSLVALELRQVRAAKAVADLGSGAGFPGLPLAIARHDASVALIESNARKCRFLERAAGACGLQNVRVVNSRAESWTEGIDSCDLVTARALAPLSVVAEYAAPLLREGGSLVAWRGARDLGAEEAAARAAHELGLEPDQPLRVFPYPAASRRHLRLMWKVRPTPERFPRRAGVAAKRPLGSGRRRGSV